MPIARLQAPTVDIAAPPRKQLGASLQQLAAGSREEVTEQERAVDVG